MLLVHMLLIPYLALLLPLARCPIDGIEQEGGSDEGAGEVADFAFCGVRILVADETRGLRVEEDQTILIRGDEIQVRGATQSVAIPPTTRVITFEASATIVTLMPGLIDAEAEVSDAGELALHLLHGVTMLCVPHGRPQHLRWRAEISQGLRLGPQLVVGAMLDPAWSAQRLLDEIKRAAQDGYDFISIPEDMPAELWRIAEAAASKSGLRLSGNIPKEDARRDDLNALHWVAGLSAFAGENSVTSQEGWIALLSPKSRGVVTNLVGYEGRLRYATEGERVFAPWEETDCSPIWRRFCAAGASDLGQQSLVENAKEMELSLAWQKELLHILFREGVDLMPGSQALLSCVLPGRGLHEELKLWVAAGISTVRVLEQATKGAARLQVDEASGDISPRGRANLILVEGKPDERIGDLARVLGVVRNGRWVERAALEAEVEATRLRWASEKALAAALVGPAEMFESFIEQVRAERDANAKQTWCEDTIERAAELTIGSQRAAEALVLCDFCLEQWPTSARIHLRRAQALQALGQPQAAQAAVLRALELEPGLREALHWLADHPQDAGG